MKYLSSAPLLLFDPADSQGAFNLGQGGRISLYHRIVHVSQFIVKISEFISLLKKCQHMPTRLAPTILTSAKSHTVPPTARAHGTSHALAQKLQRSQAPLGFEISLGRSTGSPKKKTDSMLLIKNREASYTEDRNRWISSFDRYCSIWMLATQMKGSSRR